MKIAICAELFMLWDGGIDFIYNIFLGLKKLKENSDMEIYLFIPKEFLAKRVLKAILKKSGDYKNYKYYLRHLLDVFTDSDVEIVYYSVLKVDCLGINDKGKLFSRKLTKKRIDFVFPIMNYTIDYSLIKIPYVSYIPDLQHCRLSGYFSETEINRRNCDFNFVMKTANRILVNAIEVKNDINHFFPNNKANIYVQPFSPICKMEWLDISMQNEYGRYFIISNQFWKHKDYKTAFEAFEKFYNCGYSDVKLVCTGKMEDYRNIEHIDELKQLIATINSKNNIILTGYVEKDKQIGLIRNAVAMIQPTHFEGGPGGGSVYNALSLGIPCIVSDIPVNKEIEEEFEVIFFKCGDKDDLAEKMMLVNSKYAPNYSRDMLILRREQILNRYAGFLNTMLNETIKDFINEK